MSKKPRLSKNLLQMKFMQRSKAQEDDVAESVQKKFEKRQVEPRECCSKIHYRTELSYLALEDLSFGRMSFQGFNPEVEKWMAHYAALREEAKLAKSKRKGDMEMDVTNEEAAVRLSNVARTIGRKFSKKRIRAETGSDAEDNDESSSTQKKISMRSVTRTTSKRFRCPTDI